MHLLVDQRPVSVSLGARDQVLLEVDKRGRDDAFEEALVFLWLGKRPV